MTGVTTVTVRPEDGAGRLDRWFKRHYPGLGHGRLEKLLRTGQIRVDGKRARAGDPVAPGQSIRVPPLPDASPPAAPEAAGKTPRARPQDVALLRDAVLYRDDWALVVNKPAGLAVQGGTNTDRHVDALLDGLRFESAERPRLVHRLDKDTSGVLLIARHAAAASFFTRAFRDKTTRKIYWAIVAGLPRPERGRIDLALSKGGGAAGASACMPTTRTARAPSPITGCSTMPAIGRAGWRCCRSPGARTSCAPIAPRSARRSSATASTVAQRRICRAARRRIVCICMRAASKSRTPTAERCG